MKLWQNAFAYFVGVIHWKYPRLKTLRFLLRTPVIFRRVVQSTPGEGPSFFLGANKKGLAGFTGDADT